MIREAIDKIEEMSLPQIQTHAGRGYVVTTANDVIPVPSPLPLAEPLKFHSLSGLAAYVTADFDEGDGDTLGIVIDGPEQVRLVDQLTDEFRQREVYAIASPYLSAPFNFGRFLDLETFVTSLQSSFEQDAATAAILKIVGNISQESVATVVDDGVSQQVTARAGIARVENVVVPNPVVLRPFRTFQEVRQPSSRYVLRVKRGSEGNLPSAALFEVGDNAWKYEAVKAIAEHLGELLGEVKVPVFA